MGVTFKATPAVGAADRLTEALARRIASGDFPVGRRLPSEREIARRFNASRPTVRQAIHSLEARGLVQVRGRSGSYVQAPSVEPVSEALRLLISRAPHVVRVRDLLEVRALFEVDMAGRAAERRSLEDLREMATTLADMGGAESAEVWATADVDFHGTLARATGNPLFVLIYDALRPVLLDQRRLTGTALPDARRHSLRYHQRIFEQVAAGDAAGARHAMRDHLSEAEQTLTRCVELEAGLGAQASPSAAADGP